MMYLAPRFIVTDHPSFGWITSPKGSIARRHLLDRPWALDNGVFTGAFNEEKWLKTLHRLRPCQATCLFIVAPDAVADSVATDRLWTHYAPLIQSLGYKAAYVAQDGCTSLPDNADALFIGGSTEWKLGTDAMNLVHSAKAKGLWVHMGRVNSRRRFHYAAMIGCDSVDGTCIAIAEKNKFNVIAWMDQTTMKL